MNANSSIIRSYGSGCVTCNGVWFKSVQAYYPMNSALMTTDGWNCISCSNGSSGYYGYGQNCVTFTPPAQCVVGTYGNGWGQDPWLTWCYSYPSGSQEYEVDLTADPTTGQITPSGPGLPFPPGSNVCNLGRGGPLSDQDSTARTSVLGMLASVDLDSLDWGQHAVNMFFTSSTCPSNGYCGSSNYTGPIYNSSPTTTIVTTTKNSVYGAMIIYLANGIWAGAQPFIGPPINTGLTGTNYWYGAVKFAALVSNPYTTISDYYGNFSCQCGYGICGSPNVTYPAGNYIELEPVDTPDSKLLNWARNVC